MMTTNDMKIFDANDFSNRLSGDEDLMSSVVEAFLPEMAQQIIHLRSAIDDEDLQKVAKYAHKMKGSSSNVSAQILCELAKSVEQLAKADDLVGLKLLENEIETSFSMLEKEMTEAFSENPNS